MSPDESSFSIVRIARQTRSEKRKKLFQIFSRQRNPNRQYGWMGGAFENVGCAGGNAWHSGKKLSTLNEKQKVVATLMEGMSMQKGAPEKYQEKTFEESKELEEQKTREALELLQRKHKLKDVAKVGVVRGNRTVVGSPRQFFLWFSKMAQDKDEAMSESS